MMRLDSTLLLLVGLAACAVSDESAESYMDDDLPPWNCDTEATGPSCGESSSVGQPAGDCSSSLDCGGGEVCAADFDGEIGSFRCEASCIDAMDDTRWCFDSEACCDPSATCTRGYCIPGEDASSTGVDSTGVDAGSSGEATGTGGSTGDASSSSGEDGTSSSGGSSGG